MGSIAVRIFGIVLSLFTQEILAMKLFLAGDVMTGRGIDQILPQSVDPRIYEPYVRDAREYVRLAEREGAEIDTPVSCGYIWGDSLDELADFLPDARIINLETAVTTSDDYWPGKGINYRMHPANVDCLTAAGIDVAGLANNHVLDWGFSGLIETLETLARANVMAVGAGQDALTATAPVTLPTPEGRRLLTFAFGHPSSGIPLEWEAEEGRPGVNLFWRNESVVDSVRSFAQSEDLVVVSIHWGGNWGYDIPEWQRELAHRLIDDAGVDIVFGHSSHHPKGMELYQDRLIVYGSGDFINDYEGISGHEAWRGDIVVMYLPTLSADGKLEDLRLVPFVSRQLRLERAPTADAQWLRDVLNRESEPLGLRFHLSDDTALVPDR